MPRPDARPSVELHPAWWFACESCGRDTFLRATPVALSALDPEDREAAEILTGDDPATGCEVYDQPEAVACGHCGEVFAVELPGCGAGDE